MAHDLHEPSGRSGVALTVRAGVVAVAPLLVGVAPFGLVAGATPVANGMPWDVAVGFSTVVFAGASQLVAIDALADGGSVLVAVIAAWAINLRMVLYSASLAPHVTRMPMRRRLGMAYLLTDQAYALSIVRISGQGREEGTDAGTGIHSGTTVGASDVGTEASLWWYYLGCGLGLWVTWQISTVIGVLVGGAVPSGLHLEFAVPLVFLVLLIPTLIDAPAILAAVVGGLAAVISAGLGAGPTSIVIGSVAGVVAGAVIDRDTGDSGTGDSGTGDSGKLDSDGGRA